MSAPVTGLDRSLRIERSPRPDFTAAACVDLPVGAFFPVKNKVDPRAVAACRRCPIRVECAEYAIADPDLTGYWAGTSERSRRITRKARRDANA